MRWRFCPRTNHGGGVYTFPESSLEISNSTSFGSSSSSSFSAAAATASSPPPSSSPSSSSSSLSSSSFPLSSSSSLLPSSPLLSSDGWIQLCLESGNLGCHIFNSLVPFLDGTLQLLYGMYVFLHGPINLF